VINGRKWFITGATHPNCKVAIVMGVTNPDNPVHARQSMILAPMDAGPHHRPQHLLHELEGDRGALRTAFQGRPRSGE
jgi:alkylation response protein AidB-like acyl-CoA dehydrogenase